jgi:predicted metal-dependent phosphoesterase TrpH
MVPLVKEAGGFCVVAHPHNQLEDIDYLMEVGIEGMEVWHPDLTEEEKERAYQIALEKNLFISGGCDHSGLCGGLYSSYHTEEELKASYHYIPDHSVGTTEHYFRELQAHKLNR